jgi:hypothetical protein
MFSRIPAPSALAESSGGDWLNDYLLPIGIVLLILFVPHVIAAQLFTPKSNPLLVIAACLMQVLFVLLVVWIFGILFLVGWTYLVIGGLIVFIMSALVITGIYRFDFLRGLGYSAASLLLITGLGWAMIKFYPELMLRRIATPIGMQLVRWGASFQTSEQEAQLLAVKHHPPLGVAGSEFNRRFLEKVAKYRADRPEELRSPGWPLVLSNEVFLELVAENAFGPKQPPQPAATP